MARQKLRTILVEGFTSIQEASVSLNDLNVLVGANGAGKSNLIKALDMLSRIMDGELGLFTGVGGGASTLRTVDFSPAAPIRLRVDFGGVGYLAELIPAAGDELVFYEEAIWEHDGEPFLMPARGYRESMMTNPDAPWREVATPIVEAIRGCRIYHFHDTSRTAAVKQNAYTADNETLRSDAANLAPVLRRLRDGSPKSYQRIVNMIRQVAPFFRDFVLEPELSPERIRLRWRQQGTETIFPADAFSEGA